MVRAILDGAAQIATPAFVSTLCICIVFVPVFFLSGVAKYLFEPLAMAVMFAMLASYFLSRTVLPTMVRFLLKGREHEAEEVHTSFFGRFHTRFITGFEKLRTRYTSALQWALDHSRTIFMAMGGLVLISLCAVPFLGRDFFPSVDAGQIRLHARAPAGTRIESTTDRFSRVSVAINEVIPPAVIDSEIANIGLPASGINLAFSDSPTISAADGEILISLKPKNRKSVATYTRLLREKLHYDFPDMSFDFPAADIVSQILNFGLPAPIDIQVTGPDPNNYGVAEQIEREVAKIPGAVDVYMRQVVDSPELNIDVDRTRAEQIGLTQQNVASTILISLSSSGQDAPNYWLNYQNGVNYQVAVQTPQYNMDTLQELSDTPIASARAFTPELLGNLASIKRAETPVILNHYNVQPVFDVLAAVQDRDLGGVANDVHKVLNGFDPKPNAIRRVAKRLGLDSILDKYHLFVVPPSKLPRGTTIAVRGQVNSMNSTFVGLAAGIAFAIVLVYFLMVVNFQSWTDPFIIITALPGALCGIVWMLLISGTTLSVPALMGSIMAIGVATSNSILMVTFANDERRAGKSAVEAALSAGYTRLRPVTMTALAMIIGMLPMSLGLGEGGEQNAPLGRAVIGGLLVATFATLFFVPVVYSILRRKELALDADQQFEQEAGELHDQPAYIAT